MANNKSLGKAKDAKNDEYYTRLSDIENELRHYKEHFRDKVILCNCDDPYESNFFKYFAMNFNYLGLKKLISTCYVSSPVMYTQLSLFDDMEYSFEKPVDKNKKPYKVEITEVADTNGDGVFDLDDIKQLLKSKNNVCTVLEGDGDFRSEECLKLLKEADIVVTNPPFSLLNEYFSVLVKYQKKFLILGNPAATHYKDVFPLIKANQIWTGYKTMSSDMLFHVSEEFAKKLVETKKEGSGYRIVNGEILGRAQAIWYTNLDIKKRHEEMILVKKYDPDVHKKYDNYDAINVDAVDSIPRDYYGLMGVPGSFLDSYNPDQFELVGVSDIPETLDGVTELGQDWINEYRRQGGTGHYTAHMKSLGFSGFGKHKVIYSRFIIRRREQPNEN